MGANHKGEGNYCDLVEAETWQTMDGWGKKTTQKYTLAASLMQHQIVNKNDNIYI